MVDFVDDDQFVFMRFQKQLGIFQLGQITAQFQIQINGFQASHFGGMPGQGRFATLPGTYECDNRKLVQHFHHFRKNIPDNHGTIITLIHEIPQSHFGFSWINKT